MKEHSGVYPAIVVDNVDPANSGRVKVRLPQVLVAGESGHEAWARIATLMAGANRGTWFIPDVGDEVVVAFEHGALNRPYVLGGLWNSANPPPETMDVNNNKKLLRSRNGVRITLDDQDGRESIVIETPGGQKLTFEGSRRRRAHRQQWQFGGAQDEPESSSTRPRGSSSTRVQSRSMRAW